MFVNIFFVEGEMKWFSMSYKVELNEIVEFIRRIMMLLARD